MKITYGAEMKITQISCKPSFSALKIDRESLPALAVQGNDYIKRLANAGNDFANYKHYDLFIKGDDAVPVIKSKDGRKKYSGFFNLAIPYNNFINISTKVDSKGTIGSFKLVFEDKSAAFSEYKKVMEFGDKKHYDYAIALTQLLEEHEENQLKKMSSVDIKPLNPFLQD